MEELALGNPTVAVNSSHFLQYVEVMVPKLEQDYLAVIYCIAVYLLMTALSRLVCFFQFVFLVYLGVD